MATRLSPEDFEAICLLVCPYCRGGDIARRRESTGEWIHSTSLARPGGSQFTHGLCWAHGLRASEVYAPIPAPGEQAPAAP
jgi:hypothetical protein